jgi:hypothetical protein
MQYGYLFNGISKGTKSRSITETMGESKWFKDLIKVFANCDAPMEYCDNDVFKALLGIAAVDYIMLDCILEAINVNCMSGEQKAIMNTFDIALFRNYGAVRSDVKDGTSQN